MTARDLPRLLRTLWYQSPSQWRGRLRGHSLGDGRARRAGGAPPTQAVAAPATSFQGPPAHVEPKGREGVQACGEFLDASALDAAASPAARWANGLGWLAHPALPADDRAWWIDRFLARRSGGAGWRADVLTERIVSLAKLLATPGALPDDEAWRAALRATLADQCTTLGALTPALAPDHPEGERALALAFGAVLLDGSASASWRTRELLLPGALATRVFPDGVQIDRSPSLHALLLERILDLLNLAAGGEGRLAAGVHAALEDLAARMLDAQGVFAHPGGGVASFGASTQDAAHAPGVLAAYAARLGLATPAPAPAHLRDGGFARLATHDECLLVTAGMPAPVDLPRHAHGDPLAFEWSIDGQRIVCDAGGDPFGGTEPALRSVLAHATAQIEGTEPTEFWGGDRVGGRPDVALPHVEVDEAGGGRIEAVCAGHATPEVLQRRTFSLGPDGLEILDRFDRVPEQVVFSFPLAPGVEVDLAGDRPTLRLDAGTVEVTGPPEAAWSVERGPCLVALGRSEERPVLRARAAQVAEALFVLRRV